MCQFKILDNMQIIKNSSALKMKEQMQMKITILQIIQMWEYQK